MAGGRRVLHPPAAALARKTRCRVPLQLQIIEPEQLAIEYDTIAANGNRIRGGVEFDAIGRRVAYYFYPERPDLEFFNNNAFYHRVTADNIIPMFDPLRAGQIRGVPVLTAALVRFWELEKFDDATLLRQQIGNLFAGFVKGNPTQSMDAHPLTGLPVGDKTMTRSLSSRSSLPRCRNSDRAKRLSSLIRRRQRKRTRTS
jgi:capsid protein